MTRALSLLLVAVACAAGPAVAQEPEPPTLTERVTLDVKGEPLLEVLTELQRQTGFEFQPAFPLGAGAQLRPITYACQDMPLKRALRAICEQVGCRAVRETAPRYRIDQGTYEERDLPTAESEGYILSVLSLTAASAVEARFGPGAAAAEPTVGAPERGLGLTLCVDAPDDPSGAAICGLSNSVILEDDAGRPVPFEGWPEPGALLAGALGVTEERHLGPSLTDVRMRFGNPSYLAFSLRGVTPVTDAKSLTLSLGLMVSETCVPVQLRFPWGQTGLEQERQGTRVAAQGFETPPTRPVRASLLFRGAGGALASPDGIDRRYRVRRYPECWVQWGSGELTANTGYSASNEAITFSCPRPSPEAEPTALIVRTFARAGPLKEVRFRLAGITLPSLEELLASAARPEGSQAAGLRLWVPRGQGGSVALDTLVDGRPLGGPRAVGLRLTRLEEEGRGEYRTPLRCETGREGRLLLSDLQPGQYALELDPETISPGGGGLLLELAQQFGIDPDEYVWVGNYAWARVVRGETTVLPPLRFVRKTHPVRPAPWAAVAEGDLSFAWDPFPGAAAYIVSLGIKPKQGAAVTFWVSKPVTGTELPFRPEEGYVQSGTARQYLDRKGEGSFYWWVNALDAEGVILSKASGGYFTLR